MTQEVDFYFGPGSRYSYLASTQLGRIERETGCRFRWLPLQSGPLISAGRKDPFEGAAGQYDWDYRKQDAAAWARHYGIDYLEPVDRLAFDPLLAALACLAAERQGAAEFFSRAVMSLIFITPGERLVQEDFEQAADFGGLDVGRFRSDMESDNLLHDMEARVKEAARRGAFGVPTFFLGEQMFWGNDRLVLLEAALRERA
ncbi:MAG: DsbA family protein [bacterium]|nr:DsbA family protein [bacterium]MDE0415426.1 DsbA family protein [bacterium]